LADIYRAAHQEELPDSTPESFLKAWLERRKAEIAPASHEAYNGRIKDFLKWLGPKASDVLSVLEKKDFIAYRDALAKRVSASTANQGIKLLRVPFEDARRDGLLPENPAKDCPILKVAKGTRRRPFTVKEVASILAVADDEWRSMILFGIYTGQRLTDIARLTWANVDTTAKEIHVRTRKTGRMVRIPICAPLAAHLENLKAGDDPIAPIHPRSAVAKNSATLSRQFSEILAAAGLATKRDHKGRDKGRGVKRETSELSFHSLRHTATSLMKNAGVSPAIVQDIIGHDTAEMSTHYTKIESAAKLEALNKLPDLRAPHSQPETQITPIQ
jgi:integrase